MVVTRSQGNAENVQEVQHTDTSRANDGCLQPGESGTEYERPRTGTEERLVSGRVSREGNEQESELLLPRERRLLSPTRTIRSDASNASCRVKIQQAKLKAAEEKASLIRRELAMERDLVDQRLETEVFVIQDEEEGGLHDADHMEDRPRVEEWLRTNPVTVRGEQDKTRQQQQQKAESSSVRNKSDIEQLAEVIGRMARPRSHHCDLPAFSGSINEWLPFKAAYVDTTKMYNMSKAENIQRLRSCLKGEARDTVAALLYTATDPEMIIKTLEQCYSRPEVIVDRALDDYKRAVGTVHRAFSIRHSFVIE